MRIGISIVLFNEPEERLIRFLETLHKVFCERDYLVCVFYNSYHDFSLSDGIIQIQSEVNVGYGKGHNVNYAELKNRFCDKVLITNTDVNFKADVLELFNNSIAVVVAPEILNIDDSNQGVVRYLPTLTDKIFSYFGVNRLSFKVINSDLHIVPSISGCFFVVNVNHYESLEYPWLFDPNYFMYEEDTDLCRRLWLAKGVYLLPKVKVQHSFAKGSSKSFKLFYFHLKSILYYFWKWGCFDAESFKSKNI